MVVLVVVLVVRMTAGMASGVSLVVTVHLDSSRGEPGGRVVVRSGVHWVPVVHGPGPGRGHRRHGGHAPLLLIR